MSLLAATALSTACGNGIPNDAVKTPSGLAYKILKKGNGTEHPLPTSIVTAHYSGWKMDGTPFDSSVQRGEPLVYPLKDLIPGWIEGMQLMVVGDKWKFWIPGKLAYDDSPRQDAPRGMLVFEIELLGIKNR